MGRGQKEIQIKMAKRKLWIYDTGIWDNKEDYGVERLDIAAYSKKQAEKILRTYKNKNFGKKTGNRYALDVAADNKTSIEDYEKDEGKKISKIGVINLR